MSTSFNMHRADEIIRDFIDGYIKSCTIIFIPQIIVHLIYYFSLAQSGYIQDNEIRYKYNLYYNNLHKAKWQIFYLSKYIQFRLCQKTIFQQYTYKGINVSDRLLVTGYLREMYINDVIYEIIGVILTYHQKQFNKQPEWTQGLAQRFEQFDLDGDGIITLSDFIRFTKRKNPNLKIDQIKNVFYQMDEDNTGKVTWKVFEKSFRRFAKKASAAKRLKEVGSTTNTSHTFDDQDIFLRKVGRKGRLQSLRVWYDDVIYGIKCIWIRKSSSSPNKIKQIIGNTHLLTAMNKNNLSEDVIIFQQNEYISGITVSIDGTDSAVKGITIETGQHKLYAFGSSEGTATMLYAPKQHAIHAFYGGFGNLDNCLQYLGAYALPINKHLV